MGTSKAIKLRTCSSKPASDIVRVFEIFDMPIYGNTTAVKLQHLVCSPTQTEGNPGESVGIILKTRQRKKNESDFVFQLGYIKTEIKLVKMSCIKMLDFIFIL